MTLNPETIAQLINGVTPEFTGVVSVHEGENAIFAQGYGYANRAERLPNTPETRFGVASGSKIFTAIAILQLVEQGRLGFDSRLLELVKADFPHFDPGITVHHLLTHTSGAPDYFGGVSAPQSIVSALMQGPDDAFALGEDIAKTIFQPIVRSYRVTVEQMALLEPGLSETVCATLLDVMREAMDEVVSRGVPAEAARDFLLGHMTILSAVIFKQIPGQFSDACNKAITFGKPRLMRDDWKAVFDGKEIAESIERIT